MKLTEQRIREIAQEEIKAALEKGAAEKTAHPYGDSDNGVFQHGSSPNIQYRG